MSASTRDLDPPVGPSDRHRLSVSVISRDNEVGDVVRLAEAVRAVGLDGLWMQQAQGPDALTALAVAGGRVPDLALGVGVVPVTPRHPLVLAAQVRTVVDVVGSRLTVGLGPSHRRFVEGRWGLSYDRPYSDLSDRLEVIGPELADDRGTPCCGLVLAALGPRMLALAGRQTEGTALWMVGPETIREHIAPAVRVAAREAGRPPPRVITIVPAVVTDDPRSGRRTAARALAGYGREPAYRRMLRHERAVPEDLAIIGDEAALAAGFEALRAAGATEIVVLPVASIEERPDALAVIGEARRRLHDGPAA